MYKILLVVLLFTSYNVNAENYPFNDTNWWQRLVYEEQPITKHFSKADTCIIVVSNRSKTENPLRFMSEIRGNGTLLYFFVYAQEGKWHVLRVNNLEEAINYMPAKNDDWVVYTEGMGKIFTTEVNRGMQMASQYGVNVIMLDYPSISTTKKHLGNYLFSIRNARNSYKDYVPVLDTIKQQYIAGNMGKGSMTLFFHSMGNYLIQQTVKRKQLFHINDTVWVNNIILNAACVPQRAHKKWISRINFAERIYVHYNPKDYTLFWPELVNKKKQLGRRLNSSLCSKVNYINFHPLVGENHSYFLTLHGRLIVQPEAWKHYNVILHGGAVDLNKLPYRISEYKKKGFDILPD